MPEATTFFALSPLSLESLGSLNINNPSLLSKSLRAMERQSPSLGLAFVNMAGI